MADKAKIAEKRWLRNADTRVEIARNENHTGDKSAFAWGEGKPKAGTVRIMRVVELSSFFLFRLIVPGTYEAS